DFRGTVVSGGTTSGVAGVVGALGHAHEGRIRTIGYLPERLPEGTRADNRYGELRRTPGATSFTVAEPLRSWVDIVSSGTHPADVKVLATDGGEITRAEVHLAAALGATVARVSSSAVGIATAHGASQPGDDPLPLPRDAQTLRAFVRAETRAM